MEYKRRGYIVKNTLCSVKGGEFIDRVTECQVLNYMYLFSKKSWFPELA
jgi:hypothetical protein